MFTDEEFIKISQIDSKIDDLLSYIESLGNSRELSLAKTKVEEAQLWMLKYLSKKD